MLGDYFLRIFMVYSCVILGEESLPAGRTLAFGWVKDGRAKVDGDGW